MFGLAPALSLIFDTTAELKAASGILGVAFGIVLDEGGETGFETGGGGGDFEDVGAGAASGCCGIDGFAVSVVRIVFEDCAGMWFICAACEACVLFEGSVAEIFDMVGTGVAAFAGSSRTCCNIFELSAVTVFSGGAVCGATFTEFGAALGKGADASIDCESDFGTTADFGVDFLTTGTFVVAVAFFVVLGVAVVDFARLGAFLTSGAVNSTSIGSETIFFGRPLFLTIVSADILNIGTCESWWSVEEAMW